MDLKEIKNKILAILETNDITKIENFGLEIGKSLKADSFQSQIQFFDNLDLPLKAKIKLYLIIANSKDHSGFSKEIIPYLVETLIEEQNEEFFSIITEDENIQAIYTDYYKIARDINTIKNSSYLLSLPKFKEKVLTDEDFICNQMTQSEYFFENLPKEFGYLISFYDTKSNDLSNLENFYEKYFGTTFSKEEQLELIYLQNQINTSSNILKLSPKDRMSDLKFILEHSSSDKDFYRNMKNIQNRTGLDMKSLISFAHKYSNTKLYEILTYEAEPLTQDVIRKVFYLSHEDKIINISNFEDIEQISIQEMENMPKERKTGVTSKLLGGPQSTSSKHIFSDSYHREVRRIDKNGEIKILPLTNYNDHNYGVQRIYEDSIEFSKNCSLASERALEVAKQLSSATYVIEGDQCFIYVPSNISIEQKNVSRNWLNTACDSGVLGIFIYDHELEDFYVANNGDEMDKTQAKTFILNLNGRITEEELDEAISNNSKVTMQQLAKKAIVEGSRTSTLSAVQKQLDKLSQKDLDDDINRNDD